MKHSPFDVTISALDAETSVLAAVTSALARSFLRYGRGVSGDIGDCGVGMTFAFRSREVKRLLLDLNSYGGTDPLGMFPLFFEEDRCGSGPSSCCGISPASSFG